MRRTHGGQALHLLANASFVAVDSSSTPEAACHRLGGLRYAIVVASADPDARPEGTEPGQPFALCTAADLDRAREAGVPTLADPSAGLAATLVLPAALTLGELAASDTVTLLDLSPHGAVVMDGTDIVGVLDHQVVDDHLATTATLPGETRGPAGSLPSDSTLGGAPQLAAARVVCGHTGCGYVNELSFYDHGHPPLCQNRVRGEHVLLIARK